MVVQLNLSVFDQLLKLRSSSLVVIKHILTLKWWGETRIANEWMNASLCFGGCGRRALYWKNGGSWLLVRRELTVRSAWTSQDRRRIALNTTKIRDLENIMVGILPIQTLERRFSHTTRRRKWDDVGRRRKQFPYHGHFVGTLFRDVTRALERASQAMLSLFGRTVYVCWLFQQVPVRIYLSSTHAKV